MVLVDARGVQTERTGMELTLLHLLSEELKQIFVLIIFVRAYIYYKMEGIGDDIMLGAALDHRDRHLRGT